ncbi:hypothetical protein LSAT2_017148 [Lamellibrachia satsuma]|nr:hypothetical protein LSAT2_017148 [Lamellibrachia satsuma]
MSESREATGDNEVVREVPDKAASSFHISKPNRTVIVEPIALLIGLCVMPTAMLSQFYIVAYYTKQLSNGTIVNSSHHNGNHRSESLCDVNKSDPVFVFGEEVQRRAANFSLILGLCSLIPALFVTMFIGAYSDKAGRRYAIIPPIAGCTLRAISYVMVIWLKLPVEYLVIGAVMEGFGGHYHTMLLGCFAYISDIVPADRRSLRITTLETCVIIPAVFTPLGFGYWVKNGGFLAPFLAVLALSLIILVYATFFVPETVLRNPEAKLFSTKHIKNTMLLFTKDDDTRRRWKLCVLLCAVFVCGVAKVGYLVDTLFQMNRPLCWTRDIIGYFLSVKVAVVGAGAVLSIRLLKCCMQDGGIALTSGLMGVVSSAYTAFVQNSIMMYITPLMSMFDFLFLPTARALMSSLVHDHQQGALYGGIAFIEVICSLVGDVLFNSVYSATLYIMTGFVFLVMAAFYAVGSLLIVVFIVKMGRENRTYMKFDDDGVADERGTSLPSLHIE